MCGVFGYIGARQDAPALVLEGLKRLEYRGYDSWGVAVMPDSASTIAIKKHVGKIGAGTVDELVHGSVCFGHTRWATHGGVTSQNSHPHLDCSKSIAVVHNGIFENYQAYKDKLLSLGHTFTSDTDSEVFVHLLEEHAKTLDFVEAVRKTFALMQGLNAVIAMHLPERKFVAVRHGSPLVIGFGQGENYVASDPAALLAHTSNVYFLEDQELVTVTHNHVDLMDSRTGKNKTIQPQQLDWEAAQTEKGSYEYFMLKEIHEQPHILASIAASATTHTQTVANALREASHIYLVGCGTAAFACQVGFYLFSKIANVHPTCTVGSEFSYHLNGVTSDDLVLALSQSGETMDLLEPVKQAKAKEATITALVNVLGSSLYRLADEKIGLGAGPEKAVASTKAFTAKVAHLLLLAYACDNRLDKGKALLTQAAQATRAVLSVNSVLKIKTLANNLKTAQHLYVLGRGISYPLSLESALKIKEISYIHAEGLATGELKHGTLALISQGTPCMVFLPNDETYEANLAGAMEVKARGGYIIGVSYQPHDVFDYYLEVKDVQEASIIPNVVVAQLLAYYLSLELGLDPDMPRNLAKSVTVK